MTDTLTTLLAARPWLLWVGALVVLALGASVQHVWLRARIARDNRARSLARDGAIGGPIRLTENRRAQLLEHLGTIRESWGSLHDETRAADGVGDAAMLYPQASWLAEKLDEMLTEHVRVEASVQPGDEAPRKPLRDRMRAMVSMGKGRQETGG